MHFLLCKFSSGQFISSFYYSHIIARNDHLVPQNFNFSNIDLILDSIARLINDEKTNIVSSVQLFTKCNSNKIEYISITNKLRLRITFNCYFKRVDSF